MGRSLRLIKPTLELADLRLCDLVQVGVLRRQSELSGTPPSLPPHSSVGLVPLNSNEVRIVSNRIPRYLQVAIAWLGIELLGLVVLGLVGSETRTVGMFLGFGISVVGATASSGYLVTGVIDGLIQRTPAPRSASVDSSYFNILEIAFATWVLAAVGGTFAFSGMFFDLRPAQLVGFVLAAGAIAAGFVAVIVGIVGAVYRTSGRRRG